MDTKIKGRNAVPFSYITPLVFSFVWPMNYDASYSIASSSSTVGTSSSLALRSSLCIVKATILVKVVTNIPKLSLTGEVVAPWYRGDIILAEVDFKEA